MTRSLHGTLRPGHLACMLALLGGCMASGVVVAQQDGSVALASANATGEPEQQSQSAKSIGARVTGTVRLESEAPEPKVFEAGKMHEAVCDEAVEAGVLRDDRVLVDANSGLANALVFLSSTGNDLPGSVRYPADGEPAGLRIASCAYTPRVIGMRAGQVLEVRSDDPVLHHPHPHPDRARQTSYPVGRMQGNLVLRWTVKKPDAPFRVSCDVHTWERAWVGVFKHPWFAVTDEHGVFALPAGLPPGTYILSAWHEVFGQVDRELLVTEADRDRMLDFVL